MSNNLPSNKKVEQAFDSLTESLSSGVGRFCHMIKLIKYHVTKRPGRSPELISNVVIQCRSLASLCLNINLRS